MSKKSVKKIVDEVMAAEEPVIIAEELNIPVVEEIIEDDVLVEDKPATELPKFKMGDAVSLVSGAQYVSGGAIPANLFNNKIYIRTVKENGYGIAAQMTGRISGTVAHKDVVAYVENAAIDNKPENVYIALIKDQEVDIKSRPDENSKTLKTLHRHNGLFTIVGEKDGWGHLKIGGWIPMSSYKKLN